MQPEEGKILSGKITGITNFGAFVDLGDGVTGMVHISEISTSYVKDINEQVKVGDVVEVKVLPSEKKGKIALSIKQAIKEKTPQQSNNRITPERRGRAPKLPETDLHAKPAEFDWFKPQESDMSFEDKLNKFKQASDERMHDIKRNMESKRGGRTKGSY